MRGPDGWGDNWMDGRMARRTGEWDGKTGVGEWTGWMDGETTGLTGGWVGRSFDGSMALCECGCTNTLWMGDVLASESLLTPVPGRWVLYHKHDSMPTL